MLKGSLARGRDTRGPRLLMFRKGETIYSEGEPARAWFVVDQGVSRTCRFYTNGHRQVIGFQYAGDVLGCDAGVRSDCAEAVTDMIVRYCDIGMVPCPDGDAPDASVEDSLRNSLGNLHRSISLFGRRTAPERLAAFILMLAERTGFDRDVELPMCRTDIGDYLGLTIHTVSRTLTQMCRDHLIACEGPHHCCILDHAALQALAEGVD